MPLIKCPDCEKPISDAAPACVHCGRPMTTKVPSRRTLPVDPDVRVSHLIEDARHIVEHGEKHGGYLEPARFARHHEAVGYLDEAQKLAGPDDVAEIAEVRRGAEELIGPSELGNWESAMLLSQADLLESDGRHEEAADLLRQAETLHPTSSWASEIRRRIPSRFLTFPAPTAKPRRYS